MAYSLQTPRIYLHACVVKKDGGMFATCHIPGETVIAAVHKNQSFSKMPEMGFVEYSDYLSAARRNTTHPHYALAIALPTTCQNPRSNCGFPMRRETTVTGRELINVTTSTFRSSVMDSVVSSRQWDIGIIPILDMFNHHRLGTLMRTNGTHSYLTTTYCQPKGSQIYIRYNDNRAFINYITYGFIDYSAHFDCDDMRYLRLRNHNKTRIQCIANSTSSKNLMEEEQKEALIVNDIAMVQGAALWLRAYQEQSRRQPFTPTGTA